MKISACNYNVNPSSVKSKERVLIVEVFDKDEFGKHDFEGMVVIPIKSLDNQEKAEEVYQLKNKDGGFNSGKIRLKLQFVWSKYKFYEDLIKKKRIKA